MQGNATKNSDIRNRRTISGLRSAMSGHGKAVPRVLQLVTLISVMGIQGLAFAGDGTSLGASLLFILFFSAIAIGIYFLPWFVALSRDHPSTVAIFVLNFFAGWTFIGWVGSLVWAFTQSNADATADHDSSTPHPAQARYRTCPYCAEEIRFEAIKCRHCNSDVTAT